MSTAAKLTLGALGTAATIYGCVVGRRALNKPSLEKVAQNFSEIFRRDVSKEEAQKMSDRFAQIFKIKDEKEFQNTLFNQIKKDFGLEYTNFGYQIKKLERGELGYFNQFGLPKLRGRVFDINPNNCFVFDSQRAKSRTALFKTMVHEMNHAKQFEIMCRTNFQEACVVTLQNMTKTKRVRLELEKMLKELVEGCMGKVAKNDLAKGSKEYELGLKYIENEKNYIQPQKDFIGYRKQLVEVESRHVEDLMGKSLDYFLPIWRL